MVVEELSASVAGIICGLDGFVFRIGGAGIRRSAIVIDGYVVTAAHGLDPDDPVKFHDSNGRSASLEPAGVDRRLDLAFFGTRGDYPTAPVCNGEGLKVGNLVFALGRPGSTLRASFGMIGVFAPEFRGPTGVKLVPYMEVDGTLPTGFSGGPLISHSGELIGMNTSVPRGSGMTVPVANIRMSIDEIGKDGTRKVGYLGVNTAEARLRDGEAGLVVTGVDTSSPAACAGLEAGDVILKINDEPMISQAALYHTLLDGPREVNLTVKRGDGRKEFRVSLGERKDD